ncbi:ABC transporter substrate-binding protein [Guptibacillus hwajinpoensis]|uniref:ABC transporter substrate-binding protein n=1 Tax=Guptibacillus hwajinpoensis TaxID=208199 RepID=UPI0018842C3A|nr:ABC transporter substrate-binding protein [Pseudalkalibacillus hwajinpoensis]MBF0705939.1 ABC transporter substrate-binding protein [Pseudalkalibacillus hwajinpoensis]
MRIMKNSKLLFIVLALILVLSACSSSNNSSSNNNSSGDENASSGDEEKVTLVYARGKDATGSTDVMVEEFMKQNPNIEIEFREMPTDTGAQHDAYVTMLNAESSEIDVFDIDVIWPAEFAQAGYVLPLDRFIEKDGINMDDYNQGPVTAATFNGKQWAMPKFIDTGMLFYRSDLVSEAPKTWDDLMTQASELKGEDGTKFGYLMQAKQYEGLVTNAVEFVGSYGGAFIDENGEVVINSPEAIKGISKMVEIANSDFVPGNINTFTEVESHTAFIEGQSPFIRNWPYQFALANDEEQSKIVGNVEVAPLPEGDAGSASALGGWMAAINNFSEHPQEAWEFLKFMTGKEGQKIDAIKGSHAPTIPALFEDEEIIEANPFFGEEGFQTALEAAVSRPVAPNYPEISEIIQIHISKAIAGEETPEEAAAAMEKEMNEKLEK